MALGKGNGNLDFLISVKTRQKHMGHIMIQPQDDCIIDMKIVIKSYNSPLITIYIENYYKIFTCISFTMYLGPPSFHNTISSDHFLRSQGHFWIYKNLNKVELNLAIYLGTSVFSKKPNNILSAILLSELRTGLFKVVAVWIIHGE